MWQYEKKLQFPINIKCPNPKLANFIISQYGGPYGDCLSVSPLFFSPPKDTLQRFVILTAFYNGFKD